MSASPARGTDETRHRAPSGGGAIHSRGASPCPRAISRYSSIRWKSLARALAPRASRNVNSRISCDSFRRTCYEIRIGALDELFLSGNVKTSYFISFRFTREILLLLLESHSKWNRITRDTNLHTINSPVFFFFIYLINS